MKEYKEYELLEYMDKVIIVPLDYRLFTLKLSSHSTGSTTPVRLSYLCV